MSENRKVISERVVNSMMEGFDFRKPAWPWYKKLWMRVKWRYEDLAYWWRKKQQIKQDGFPHEQVWDFGHWHSEMVLPRLKFMRNNITGIPSNMFDDDYEHGKEWDMPKNERQAAENKALKRWEETLDKIIWSFENYDASINFDYPEDYDHRYTMKEYDDGSVGFESLDERSPGTITADEHEARVQEGLQLFSRNYRNLWS